MDQSFQTVTRISKVYNLQRLSHKSFAYERCQILCILVKKYIPSSTVFYTLGAFSNLSYKIIMHSLHNWKLNKGNLIHNMYRLWLIIIKRWTNWDLLFNKYHYWPFYGLGNFLVKSLWETFFALKIIHIEVVLLSWFLGH